MIDFKAFKEKKEYMEIAGELEKLEKMIRELDTEMADFMKDHLVMDPVKNTFMWKSEGIEPEKFDKMLKRMEKLTGGKK